MKYAVVYVQIDVQTADGMWAPMIAEHLFENVFLILNREPLTDYDNWKEEIKNKPYDPEYEEWEFPPGTRVRCEWFHSKSGTGFHLRAVEKFDE